jgi:hypothetical protein
LRLEAAGTKFLKKAGGPIDPALAPYFGLPEGFEFPEAFTNGLLYPMAFFMDPDGYVFELQDPSLAEAIQQ